MKIYIPERFYKFDDKLINKKFGGDLTFVNEFCINSEYLPVAVYLAANPDTSKGHKKYFIIQSDPNNTKSVIVRGMTDDEMEKERYQYGVRCLKCDCVIYSIYRHDMHSCECGHVSIDGGKSYCKISSKDMNFVKSFKLDLLTNTEYGVPSI